MMPNSLRIAASNVTVGTSHEDSYSTRAISGGFTGGGKAGVGAAVVITDYGSTSTTSVGAQINAQGSVAVTADSILNQSNAEAYASIQQPATVGPLAQNVAKFLSGVPLDRTVGGDTLQPQGGGEMAVDDAGNLISPAS
jgi:hypothetical protein